MTLPALDDPHRQKSRRSSGAGDKITSESYPCSPATSSYVAPMPSDQSSTNEQRLASLETNLSQGMQQLSSATASINLLTSTLHQSQQTSSPSNLSGFPPRNTNTDTSSHEWSADTQY